MSLHIVDGRELNDGQWAKFCADDETAEAITPAQSPKLVLAFGVWMTPCTRDYIAQEIAEA